MREGGLLNRLVLDGESTCVLAEVLLRGENPELLDEDLRALRTVELPARRRRCAANGPSIVSRWGCSVATGGLALESTLILRIQHTASWRERSARLATLCC